MKRISNKRRQRNSSVAPFREAFRLEIGQCELCGKRRHLDIHEISRGPDRSKSLDKRYAILCLGRECHDEMGNWSRAKQLCLLFIARPFDYSLCKYHALIARKHPDHGDVLDLVETIQEERECRRKVRPR